MTGMIVTARHGRPDVDRSVKITAREYGDWWANYDLTGLAPDQKPSKALCDIAAQADRVLCSTLPRAIETAEVVTGGKVNVPRDAMFVEAPLPPPPLFPSSVKLTPTTWGIISRTYWFCGYAPRGVENHFQAQKRVRGVADRLISEVLDANGDVLLCAHGYLNWMIHRVLIKRGWKLVDHQGGNNYWSHRAYRQAAHQAQESASKGSATKAVAAE